MRRAIPIRRSVMCVLALLILTLPRSAMPRVEALGENYVAFPFRSFYEQYDGMRVFGPALSGLLTAQGYPSQYFDKGRLEDHRGEVSDPLWAIMPSLLVVELMQQTPLAAVNQTDLTYADLRDASAPALRHAPPAGLRQGTQPVAGGVFVPFDPQLRAAPGYIVPDVFWRYANRADLFPTGWLYALGLPLTDALLTHTIKDGQQRTIVMQAFERSVLTYDAKNPAAWQVERGNIGADALAAAGRRPWDADGPKWIEVNLTDQWLYAYQGDELIYDTGVSSGRDGFETPTGQFAIYQKLPLQTMTGSRNGETWVVPDVPNVMYIVGDVALHGTYWHNEFGTGVRLSHGCINISLEAAALLYDWAPIGTPVWVHK